MKKEDELNEIRTDIALWSIFIMLTVVICSAIVIYDIKQIRPTYEFADGMGTKIIYKIGDLPKLKESEQ